jgi:hypothetical protein
MSEKLGCTPRAIAKSMGLGVSEMIERQKKQGQGAFVTSLVLPKKGEWEPLLLAGVKKGAEVDDLFVQATLPKGWSKERSDHSMWSYLKDDRALVRASVFYKAAFYDRDAFIGGYKERFNCSAVLEGCSNLATQFALFDKGLNRTIRMFEPVFYAVQDGILGATYKGKFYSEVTGDYCKEVFTEGADQKPDTEIVEKNDFYSRFHHVKRRHDLIHAVEELAKTDAIAFLDTIPKGLEQWGAEYDFPAWEGQ